MSATTEELKLQQIRADIARKTQEMLYEPRKYRVQFFGAIASAFVAGAAISGVFVAYVNAHQQPAPQPIVIQIPGVPK